MSSRFPTFRRWADALRVRLRPDFLHRPRYLPARTKPSQRQALLRLIAAGLEANAPLAPLLGAWSADERGVQRARVSRLARLLAQGTPLPDAAEQAGGALKSDDILAIRFGHQSGTLVAALRDAADSLESSATGMSSVRRMISYVVVFAIVAFLIVAFLMIKIIPSFQAIFEDFDMELSRPMILAINVAQNFTSYWYLFALGVALLAWIATSFRHSGVLRALVDRISGVVQPTYSADLLRKLSIAARAGRPLSGSLSTLARYHFDPALRRKLLFVRNEVEHGADPWQSMTDEGLIDRSEAAVLATADRLGNRPWILRELALAKSRRTERRWNLAAQILLPVAVVACGAFVLLNAVAVFSTLAKLISSLA